MRDWSVGRSTAGAGAGLPSNSPSPALPASSVSCDNESDGGSDSGTGVVSLVGFWAKSTFGAFWIWQLETSTARPAEWMRAIC